MSSLIEWVERSVAYAATVVGFAALGFFAMRVLA